MSPGLEVDAFQTAFVQLYGRQKSSTVIVNGSEYKGVDDVVSCAAMQT